jgi:prepilin-type N-terminal cleavage/methylation domain-containing protein
MCRGFSLIETLVTASLISALVGIALPSLASWTERRTVSLEARRLQGVLERCYAIALLRQRAVTVTCKNSRLHAALGDGHPLISHSSHHAITFQFKSAEQNKLVFYPSHTVTPATILVRGKSAQCSVVLSLRGRARSECL